MAKQLIRLSADSKINASHLAQMAHLRWKIADKLANNNDNLAVRKMRANRLNLMEMIRIVFKKGSFAKNRHKLKN